MLRGDTACIDCSKGQLLCCGVLLGSSIQKVIITSFCGLFSQLLSKLGQLGAFF
jgi:hypothetical protein